jgi:hypothetical protein
MRLVHMGPQCSLNYLSVHTAPRSYLRKLFLRTSPRYSVTPTRMYEQRAQALLRRFTPILVQPCNPFCQSSSPSKSRNSMKGSRCWTRHPKARVQGHRRDGPRRKLGSVQRLRSREVQTMMRARSVSCFSWISEDSTANILI